MLNFMMKFRINFLEFVNQEKKRLSDKYRDFTVSVTKPIIKIIGHIYDQNKI